MKYAWLSVLLMASSCLASSEESLEQVGEDGITLGLYLIYDETFFKKFAFNVSENLNNYFAALVRGAAAHFRYLDDPSIKLIFMGSSKLENESILVKKADSDANTAVDGEETMRKLEEVMTWDTSLPNGCDVVFLTSGTEVLTRQTSFTKEWKGLAIPGTICPSTRELTGHAVGLLYDDGRTFNSVQSLALQVALLVGATQDSVRRNKCRVSDGYLTSSMYGGHRPGLSACSSRSLRDFFFRNNGRENICWKDTPPAETNNEDLPVNFYEEVDYDVCQEESTKYRHFFTCQNRPKQNDPCKIPCCYNAQKDHERFVRPHRAPDGTKCAENKICVSGVCF